MNRVALLLETPAVRLYHFDHPPGEEHADPEQEVAPSYSISFVEDGGFHARVDDECWHIESGTLFISRPGMAFSCHHTDEVPSDRCLTVTYTDAAVEDLRRADIPDLRPPFARMSARRQFLRHRLQSCVAGEQVRFDLLAGALFESLAANRPSAAAPGAGDLTPLMRRVDRAVQLIETDFARDLTLADLAKAADLSPYYFARAFHRFVGVPPHRYLTGVRLRHAARMLDQGAGVTFTCYEVGFGSLSHFVTAFRRRFGVPPSGVKTGSPMHPLRAGLSAPSFVVRHRAG
jgi:AraC-like DNA-binding protein